MTAKYSLCFQPDLPTIEAVRQLKLSLAEEIGWYNSKNALAHITIAEFSTDERGITLLIERIRTLCSTFRPTPVHCNEYGQYPNGALYLALDATSSLVLKEYAKKIHQKIALPEVYKSGDPHLSIARKLDTERLQRALAYLEKPAIDFICNQVALRKFNIERRQYDIIDLFAFLDLPSTEPEQLSLF